MRLKKTYSSREVAALTGLSARQLQIWDSGGVLSPSIPSHRTDKGGYTERRYTPIQPLGVLVLAAPPSPRFPVPQLHTVVDALEDQFKVSLFEATGGGGDVRLLTDGKTIYARTGEGELFNLLEAPTQPLLVVGDEGLLRELGGKMRQRKKKPR